MIGQLARRLQRERIAGILLAALGVGVLIVALIALRSPSGRGTDAGKATATVTASTKPPATSSSASPPKSSVAKSGPSSPTAAGKLPLVILNNTKTAGLAQRAKGRFVSGGWAVTSNADFTGDILSTCAYYDPGTPGAKTAAEALRAQFPAIKRVAPKFSRLPAGPIVVVLTSDYS